MHATLFGVKRWHLQIVEASKRLLQPDSLTPARFDMMRAIAARGGELVQRNLQYLLGVSAVTISKMVTGLAQKGFVVRARLPRDRRFKNVIITASGYAALKADLKYCVDSRINEYLAAALATGDRYANIDSAAVRRRVEKTNDHLIYGRRILRDRSNARHPWSSGDFATLGMFALVHEQTPHPLRRRRRPALSNAPLPWEIPPPARRPRTAKARGPRRATTRFVEEIFDAVAGESAVDGDERANGNVDGDQAVEDTGRAQPTESSVDDHGLLAALAKAAGQVEADDLAIVALARAAIGARAPGD